MTEHVSLAALHWVTDEVLKLKTKINSNFISPNAQTIWSWTEWQRILRFELLVKFNLSHEEWKMEHKEVERMKWT